MSREAVISYQGAGTSWEQGRAGSRDELGAGTSWDELGAEEQGAEW
ncbi:hypothetical protein [Chroococcidiopsis sp. SAG 2025]|nr:hypothetical protein [Chroococcidiopsis sp. SAG 2025]